MKVIEVYGARRSIDGISAFISVPETDTQCSLYLYIDGEIEKWGEDRLIAHGFNILGQSSRWARVQTPFVRAAFGLPDRRAHK